MVHGPWMTGRAVGSGTGIRGGAETGRGVHAWSWWMLLMAWWNLRAAGILECALRWTTKSTRSLADEAITLIGMRSSDTWPASWSGSGRLASP